MVWVSFVGRAKGGFLCFWLYVAAWCKRASGIGIPDHGNQGRARARTNMQEVARPSGDTREASYVVSLGELAGLSWKMQFRSSYLVFLLHPLQTLETPSKMGA
jgi:hypothetical protein